MVLGTARACCAGMLVASRPRKEARRRDGLQHVHDADYMQHVRRCNEASIYYVASAWELKGAGRWRRSGGCLHLTVDCPVGEAIPVAGSLLQFCLHVRRYGIQAYPSC